MDISTIIELNFCDNMFNRHLEWSNLSQWKLTCQIAQMKCTAVLANKYSN